MNDTHLNKYSWTNQFFIQVFYSPKKPFPSLYTTSITAIFACSFILWFSSHCSSDHDTMVILKEFISTYVSWINLVGRSPPPCRHQHHPWRAITGRQRFGQWETHKQTNRILDRNPTPENPNYISQSPTLQKILFNSPYSSNIWSLMTAVFTVMTEPN